MEKSCQQMNSSGHNQTGTTENKIEKKFPTMRLF